MNAPDQPDNPLDHEIEQRARQLYRQAAQQLDPNTASRLRAARREALHLAETSPARIARWLIPTGAFAVLALASLMMWPSLQQNPVSAPTQAVSNSAAELDNELPPDADQTDPHLYQNLDFYSWLAANDKQPSTRQP